MKLQLPKGTRDFRPEEMIVRNKVVNTLKGIFEIYGFSPFETPLFERYEVLSSKYAGGEEILKETFKFKDQGKRELGLRYDLTVPLARFIGVNLNVKLPFKRYQIGEVFRDGPVESARYRQFTQCDVDIIGCKEVSAEAELISLASKAFNKLGFKFDIKINNRKLLNDILKYCKVSESRCDDIILSIDKLDKFGLEAVKKELKEKKLGKKEIEDIIKLISIKGNNKEKLSQVKKTLKSSEGLDEISILLDLLSSLKVDVDFDVSLARGLSYYTGTVIEIYLKNTKVKAAVCAGGRYDKMIGNFLKKGEYPSIGISFGLDRIYDAYIELNKQEKKTVTQIRVIPINTFKESLKITEELRKKNVKVEIDLSNKGPSKNLNYANSLGIPYVIFIGEDELKQNKLKLKDMKSGEEGLFTIEEIINLF